MTSTGNRGNELDIDVDLRALFLSILRDWKLVLAVALGVTALAFLAASMATSHYRAETRILIETRESVFTRPVPAGEADRTLLDEEGVTSQVEVITSADLLKQVARQLRLGELSEFDEQANMSSLGRVMVLLGLRSDPSEVAAEDRVIKSMREKLRVFRVERSRVIVISFSSTDPKLAAAVPNAIADAYLTVQQAAKLQSNADATEWLEPEIADLREKVKAAETRVAEFRAESDLMIGQNNSALATQQLSEMSTELSRIRAARATAEADAQSLRDAIRNGANLDSMPEVLSSPLIQRLRERQVQLNAEIADLSTTLLENHPRLRSMRSQLADLDGQIRNEARNVLRSLENQAETSRLRETNLIANLNQVKAESARVGDKEVELRALEREATAQRELLESYLTRYREAASRRDRSYLPADARIFSRATEPSAPYFPKVMPIAGAAFAGSLLVMALFVLLRELFSGRAMRPAPGFAVEEVRRISMPPMVPVSDEQGDETEPGVAPALDPGPKVNDVRIASDMAAERVIATGVMRAIFVSPSGDEAAASAVLVAREIADAGLRVVLLDLTSSGAAAFPMLERVDLLGITDLLASEAQFAEIIHADLYSECHVIPSGTANAARAMRAIDRLPIVMESLTTAYDVVVVECGPADADAIRRLVGDGTQVLVSAVHAGDELADEAMRDLRAAGHEIVLVKPEPLDAPSPPEPRRSAA